VNLFLRLRGMLAAPPTLIAKVTGHNLDGTSAMLLPIGAGQVTYAEGVAAGSVFTAKGTSVPVGANAYVRDGAVVSRAPEGAVSDVEIGTVAAYPFGPPRLASAGAATLPNAVLGAAYSNSLVTAVTGGYPPRAYTLIAGALPGGLALTSAGISGTPSAAGVFSFTVKCVDSTRREVTSGSIGVMVVHLAH
jgi:hypothetical protein